MKFKRIQSQSQVERADSENQRSDRTLRVEGREAGETQLPCSL